MFQNKQEKEISVILNKNNDFINLKIIDNGHGISTENINKIFEPFFTTKNSESLGLGLSLIKKIIEESFSGTISVQSELNTGTTFTIKLPL